MRSNAGIGRFEHSRSCEGTSGHEHFTCADPNDIGIRIGDGNGTDRECGFVLKDGLPGQTIVNRFPDVPGACANIHGEVITRRTGDALDSSADEGRTESLPFHVLEDGFVLELLMVLPGSQTFS